MIVREIMRSIDTSEGSVKLHHMDVKRTLLRWAYVALFTLYLLTLFTDDTLRGPHTLLHRFRELAILLMLPMLLLYLKLRRPAEENGHPIGTKFWLMNALAFAVIASAAAIELAIGATTVSALAAPSTVWVLPILGLAIGARQLWISRYK